MPSEEIFSSICGPPIAANTAVSKDVGIYGHSLTPSWTIKSTFKKSSAPPHGIAVNDTHIFAAQDQKAHVHVYSRLRGNQETLVAFPERIRSLALAGDVLILGTSEGRLILWEISTGRQVTTPPCHVQAVTCLAVTPYHLLSASEDSNIHVWSLSRLLELGADAGHEPDLTLSNHRGAVTDLVVGPSTNAETSLCVSASTDKTCILWNYQTGQVLRTLLFPSPPLCVSLDASARALFACAEDGGLYLVELFGDKPLVGSRSAELASIVVQVNAPLGVSDVADGPASCLALSHDGTSVLTGHTKGKILQWSLIDNSHPTELANLNASVTNLVYVPLLSPKKPCKVASVVKPNQSQRQYSITAQLEGDFGEDSRFSYMLNSTGLPVDVIESATASVLNSHSGIIEDTRLLKENEELKAIIEEQKELQKATMQYRDGGKTS
ncbi:WD40 domain protein [Metarhizium robertsii]|uniref:Pre-rRNA-processing protein IPI3 n=2 Tax=Metarhizium robertsii TaxID=568076 RepID=E9FBZ4_METRA|nr:U4/U6 small nuclear ribonucleoprotein Prp4 [Metarhizium robertsii ARSEF 23]EFY94765.1 U4/U6 small nuclear ribonucleoprotein Prp4 [Metarhizium robertsii ARSEF 23]EXU97093.1 WD40 domain protein [Metarhizium robertsii]